MKKRWKAHIVKGQLTIAEPDAFNAYLTTLRGDLAVTVEAWKRKTSNPQLAYYYGVVVKLLCTHTGFSQDEMDSVLKNMFMSEYVEINHYIIRKPISKTAVSTLRFETFLEDCRRWAASALEVYIPLPNEVDFQETL
jgi:hypothetical protein